MNQLARNRSKPRASLSLDLDNLWAYQMTHGDPTWETFPTYIPQFVPILLPILERLDQQITVFVVGQDAALDVNKPALRAVADAGHELGNHSYRHEPWLHRYDYGELEEEIERAEQAIEEATGARTRGFRGPGYSLAPDVLSVLMGRGYTYDCSTLPTIIGPLARAYYFRTAKLTAEQREERSYLFGSWSDARRPLAPYWWTHEGSRILEIPVTVLPGMRVPFHLSYVLYLAGRSERAAFEYFRSALRLCSLRGVEPSILLHPLDFVGADDLDALRFFPGMNLDGTKKRRVVEACLRLLGERFAVGTIAAHAAAIDGAASARTSVDITRAAHRSSGARGSVA